MTPDKAIDLIRKLTTAASSWQHAALKGRGTTRAEKSARAAAAAIFNALTGESTTLQQVNQMVEACGMI